MSKNSVFEIHFVTGNHTRMAGKNIMDAYSQTGNKTVDGNINFGLLDFYLRIPVPFNEEMTEYQIFLMKDKKSNWEPCGKITTNSFEVVESVMIEKVLREGFASGLVVRMNDEKILSWKTAQDLLVGTYPTIRTIELESVEA